MPHLLLVEDNSEVAETLQLALANKHEISIATDLASAKNLLNKVPFDLLLLDVNLPDGNGFDLYEWIKSESQQKTPTIFLTGEGELSNRLKGFQLGAQDYITKPFYPEELLVRIDMHLKSRKNRSGTQSFGDLKFEWNKQRVYLVTPQQPDQLLNLTPNEYKILSFLCENQTQTMTREEIVSSVWGDGFSLSNKVVNTHISNLRKKLLTSKCKIIASDKKGYSITE